MTKTMERSTIIFIASLLVIATVTSFSCGVLVWRFRVWPYEHLSVLITHAKNYETYGVWAPRNLVVAPPGNASRERIVMHDKEAMMPGYRAILGWDYQRNRHAVWLLDEQGKEVHQWVFRYSTLVKDQDDTGKFHAAGDEKTHALVVLDDGSIVINLEDRLLSRIDVCSKPVWVKPGAYHHSLEWSGDGMLWTWRGETSYADHYQFMQKLDPWTGDTVEEFSLIDDFVKQSPDRMKIFRLTQDFSFQHAGDAGMLDIFHVNDVEALGADKAEMYPEFSAGDLLVSLRNIDLVAVLDPARRKIKWWMHGPWFHQHDPDFGADGRISVFNNNVLQRQSNIVYVDPKNNNVSIPALTEQAVFYTEEMGKHERLPNGNILITVPGEGRILEVTSDGELAFEFNNVINNRANGYVANARWLPADFFKTAPSCSG